jgi:hypothetical protein
MTQGWRDGHSRSRGSFAAAGQAAKCTRNDAVKPRSNATCLDRQDRLPGRPNRSRQRVRAALRAEIARTVSAPHEIDDEMRHLHSVLGSPGFESRPRTETPVS